MTVVAATWLLTLLVHGFIVSAAAILVVPRISRRPRVRVVLWRAALVAPLITATTVIALDAVAPRQTLDVTRPVRRFLPASWRREEVQVLDDRQLGGPLVEQRHIDNPLGERLAELLAFAGLLAGVAVGGRDLIARRRAIAALGARSPIGGGSELIVPRIFIGTRTIRYTTSPNLTSPVAMRGDEICLPRSALAGLGIPERTSVLLHEVAHLERRDPFWLDLVRAVMTATPWRPFGRPLLRALRRDTELATDDRAIELGADPRALVGALAWFAASMEHEPLSLGVGLALGESALIERCRRILAIRDAASPASRVPVATMLGGAAVMAGAISLLVALPLPTPANRDLLRPPGNLPGTARVQRVLEITHPPHDTELVSHVRSPVPALSQRRDSSR